MTITDTAAQAAIGAAARDLHLPAVRTEAVRLAEIAVRERQTHLVFLAEVLAAEVDERRVRRRTRRLNEARFPRHKRLAEFDVDLVPGSGAAQLAALASGTYLDAGEPIVLLGDSGTGKSHLLIGLGIAACEQDRCPCLRVERLGGSALRRGGVPLQRSWFSSRSSGPSTGRWR